VPCPRPAATISRRDLFAKAAGAAAAFGVAARSALGEPDRQQPILQRLKVKPVLLYQLFERKEARSWRPWGGLQNAQQVKEEEQRIQNELSMMSANADFDLEVLPLASVDTVDKAAQAVAASDHDVTLIYAASGGGQALEALAAPKPWNIVFVRHRSGPVYLWYEIAHPRFLRKTVDEYGQKGMDVEDVVVDSYDDILTRLRALYGLKNALGKRIVCIGGAGGWGQGGKKAPELTKSIWKMDLQDVTYPELSKRIAAARKNDALVKRTRMMADAYLGKRGVKLETDRKFVHNAFLLNEVFLDLLTEYKTDALTVNQCMGTIMGVSETTACMPLSLLNDAGYMAFCESDFVVIPSGVLLRYVSGKPMFLNDPTYPHHGVVTLAHCTAPRRMDGYRDEPVRILTHFESDYGASPKVEMRKGEKVTNLIPDFASKHWVGFEGEIVDVPFLPICRSQIDVSIQGDMQRLLTEMKGFHWMTSYGRYFNESAYALRKAGIELVDIRRQAS
jgi:hypothetical protein